MYSKKHGHVLRDIDRLLEREPKQVDNFKVDTYISDRGKIYRTYTMNDSGLSLLISKYEQGVRSANLEKAFGDWLKEFIHNIKIIQQYTINKYRIDFFLPDLNIAIEYDEKEHNYHIDKDRLREKEIISKYKNIIFIRINEGEEIAGLKKLLFIIKEITGRCPLEVI